MTYHKSVFCIILSLIFVFFTTGCFFFIEEEPEIAITLLPLTAGGATHLFEYDNKIFIGHNTYSGAGCLQYYDPLTEQVYTTGITGTDIVKPLYDPVSGRIFFNNGITTCYIDVTEDSESWSAVEITAGTAPGADMALYNGTVFVLNTTWSAPYANTLYIIDAGTAALINTIDLNQGAPTDQDSLSKLGFDPADNKLYFTDTMDGEVFSCNADGSNITYETTTNSGSTGTIYFNNGNAYVLVGLTSAGDMGVHMFTTDAPGETTTHYIDSGDLSAQYMVFKDANTAYITHYSGGVYAFNPSDSGSDFSILKGTDPSDLTGLQDILLSGGILYTVVNNYPGDSYLMIIEDIPSYN